MRYPNLFIAGCQKSGTTWLRTSLSKSRYVFCSDQKPFEHFNKPDFDVRYAANTNTFSAPVGVPYCVEATPHYFQSANRFTDTARNIHRAVPEAKVILIFRDPVARYESAYIHHMMRGRLPYTPEITEFTDKFKMLTLGAYGAAFHHWLRVFPKLSAHLYDDLETDKVGMVDTIMQYLEVENDITPEMLDFRVNDTKTNAANMPEAWDVMPQLSPDLYKRLAAHYASEILQLQFLLGRDLQHWGKRFG